MRIIGGTLKGRRFDPPITNWKTRPTTDFAKEALFNILENQLDLDEINALDLFTGTGNIALELVSRGCPKVTAVDKFPAAIRYISALSREWGISGKIEIVRSDVRQFLQNRANAYELVFADPPYDLPWLGDLPDLILSSDVSKRGTLIAIEHPSNIRFTDHPSFHDERKYGQSAFTFFIK